MKLIGGRDPEQVLSEIELEDDDLRVRGQLDLLLLGDEIVIVDLKTQTMLDEGLPEWVEFQLTVYAHLVQKTYGRLPTRAEVFSLNRGRWEVQITQESILKALAAIETARAAGQSLAKPSRDACHFCERRLVCEPHWDEVTAWPEADAVEGLVQRAEHAASGVVAMLIDTADGAAWVSGIPYDVAGEARHSLVRLIRLRRVLRGDGEISEWRWTKLSAIAAHAPITLS